MRGLQRGEVGADPGEDGLAVGGGELLFVLRRHLAGFDLVKDAEPQFAVGGEVREVAGAGEVEFGFLFFGTVALGAVGFEDGEDP